MRLIAALPPKLGNMPQPLRVLACTVTVCSRRGGTHPCLPSTGVPSRHGGGDECVLLGFPVVEESGYVFFYFFLVSLRCLHSGAG